MKKGLKKSWWLVALPFLVILGEITYANPLNSVVESFWDATNDLLLEPRWYITTEVRMQRNALVRMGEIGNSFYTDPLVPTYRTTIRVGDPLKLTLEATYEFTPYTESQTSYRSSGSERLLLRSSYTINPNCLSVNVETGWDKDRYGPGFMIYDPFLAAGVEGGGFTEECTEGTYRLGAGFNLVFPSNMKRIVDLSISVGAQQKSKLYPKSETPSIESMKNNDLVNRMNAYGNFSSSITFSPKFKVTLRGDLAPDQRIGYYTTGGYAELYYTSKTLEIGAEYELNPALKFGVGYSNQERISGQTIGTGAEEFGLPAEERKTGKDEFYIKVDFHP
ncbi:hypothetical protein KAX35_01455 [candidate division WOR-3 bacterium]|nr:hypothetical protein [candidate division WOR-3 bacterium]